MRNMMTLHIERDGDVIRIGRPTAFSTEPLVVCADTDPIGPMVWLASVYAEALSQIRSQKVTAFNHNGGRPRCTHNTEDYDAGARLRSIREERAGR